MKFGVENSSLTPPAGEKLAASHNKKKKNKTQKQGFPEKATVQHEVISYNCFVKVEYMLSELL